MKIGDKVICRSNEPEPLKIAHIVAFETIGKFSKTTIPIVIDEAGKEWWILGICVEYTEELYQHLTSLPDHKAQWDYLKRKP